MRRIAILAIVSVFGVGCHTTYYHARFPVLERPERPILSNVAGSEMVKMSDDARRIVVGNLNALIDYSKKLEVTVDEYNKYAVEQNKILDGISKEK